MTARAKTRAAAAVALCIAGAATLAALVNGHGGARGRSAAGTVEPLSVAAIAKVGGTVAEVLVRQGDTVSKGRPLLRFESGTLVDQRRALVAALESTKGVASIPRAANDLAVDAHPEVLAAEEEYVRALAWFEQSRADGREGLERAARARTETRRRIGRLLMKSTAGLSSTAAMLEARLRDIDRALEDREVRAPADGTVEMLDLRAGDRVAPGGPGALLTVPGEYVCEFTVGSVGSIAPGVVLRGSIDGGLRVEARVERVDTRRVPVALREDRRIADEIVVRARFSTEAQIPAGSPMRVELP
jgi:multidrug resistance efflux pump